MLAIRAYRLDKTRERSLGQHSGCTNKIVANFRLNIIGINL